MLGPSNEELIVIDFMTDIEGLMDFSATAGEWNTYNELMNLYGELEDTLSELTTV